MARTAAQRSAASPHSAASTAAWQAGNSASAEGVGTALGPGGELTANGGRVLNVTACGTSVREAQARAYAAADAIDFPDGFCRRDIGQREVARELSGGAG